MRVLVTNDDGIASPNLHAMASHLETCGHDVLVVAPNEDMSVASASIGRLPGNDLVAMTTVEIKGVSEVGRAIDGPPGLAVIAAMFGAFGDPLDLVVSGGVTEDRLETDHRLPILVEHHVAAAPAAGDVEVAGAEQVS